MSTGNWLPGKREDQLAMAVSWNDILTEKAAAWGIPTTEVNELRLKTADACQKAYGFLA